MSPASDERYGRKGNGGRNGNGRGDGDHGKDERANHRLWPMLITMGLVLVILVNALFIYIAVSGADDIVPSYLTEER